MRASAEPLQNFLSINLSVDSSSEIRVYLLLLLLFTNQNLVNERTAFLCRSHVMMNLQTELSW